MKEKLNVSEDCSNMNSLPNIKIIIPYRKDYYSKERVTYSKKKKEILNKDVTSNEEIATIFNNQSKNTVEDRKDKTDDVFGKFEIELTAEDYILDGKKIKKNKENNLLDGNQCHPAFMALNVPAPRGPLFVFGEYFLRKFYTVFDRDREVIGFALSKEESEKANVNINTPYDEIDEISNLKKTSTNEGIKKELKIDSQNNFESILEKIENQIKSIENDINSNDKVSNSNDIIDNTSKNQKINKVIEKNDEKENINAHNFSNNKNNTKSNDDISNFENFLDNLNIRTSSFLDKDLNLNLI